MAEKDKQVTSSNDAQQPGQVIAPGGAVQPPVDLPVAAAEQQPVPTQPQTEPEQNTDPSPESPHPSLSDVDSITWTASEFVAHEKSSGWYVRLAAAAVVIAVLVYLPTKDAISTAVVLIGALMLGIYARRQPRQLQYRLDAGGIEIGQKYYAYEEFRSFSIVPEGAFSSIIFMPLKRFAPVTTVYCAPEDEDRIVDLLADRLPFEEHTHDAVDRLMRRIRF